MAKSVRPEDWRKKIPEDWSMDVSTILSTAQLIVEAKECLPPGNYKKFVDTLPFVKRTRDRLIRIGLCEALHNPKVRKVLPRKWSVLYELTRLSSKKFQAALRKKQIHPKMTRQEVEALRKGVTVETAAAKKAKLAFTISIQGKLDDRALNSLFDIVMEAQGRIETIDAELGGRVISTEMSGVLKRFLDNQDKDALAEQEAAKKAAITFIRYKLAESRNAMRAKSHDAKNRYSWLKYIHKQEEFEKLQYKAIEELDALLSELGADFTVEQLCIDTATRDLILKKFKDAPKDPRFAGFKFS